MPRYLVALAAALVLVSHATQVHGQTFTPVASPAIAGHVAFSTGATWVDFDGDGDLDLYVTTGFVGDVSNVLYRNDAGSFVRVTGVPVVQDAADTACSTWADYDNDGDVDCFISNLVNTGGMLYTNGGGGALTLATGSALTSTSLKGTGCAWGDYDNDGHVDLIVAALIGQGNIVTGNRLFHNQGDGTFAEVTGVHPVIVADSHHHPTWSDYDGDGDLDLFFATGAAGATKLDRLYRNQLQETGTASFTPITTGIIATEPRDSQTLTWVDYDNDGDLDLYTINYSTVANQLYRHDGANFTKVTTAGPIVTELGSGHGAVWGDYDNDGDQDVFVVRDLNGFDRYYRNEGNGTFVRISTGPLVTQPLSGYGAAAADYDQDGDLDLFVPTARNEAASILFRNDLAAGNHWLVVKARGTTANRSAIGAKVRVHASIGGTGRWQMRETLAGTSFGGHNALEAHFGVGDAAVVDTLRIEWPGGGVDQLVAVAVDSRIEVIQGQATLGVAPPATSLQPSFTLMPNPARGVGAAAFRLEAAGRVTLELFDPTGRRRLMTRSEWLEAGPHRWPIDTPSVPGVYLIRLAAGGRVATRRWVVTR
jgi:hypothetical protein